MGKTNKIIILIAIILIVILGIKIITNKNKDKQEVKETTNQIATKKSNEKFEIYNIDIKTDSGSTKFTATIENISGKKTEQQRIEIILIDKNENEIGTIIATIPSLENNEISEIVAEDLKVYNDIYDFKIK